ncbi:MAG: hypothetical protein LLF99_12670 [Desulfobacteraceae bacterium]|nr:hypothetical protein [Desulfobacteraceae bacterium]
MSEREDERYLLRLHVAGHTPMSLEAFANLKRTCEEHLYSRYEIEIVDLVENQKLARAGQIVGTRRPCASSSAICPTGNGYSSSATGSQCRRLLRRRPWKGKRTSGSLRSSWSARFFAGCSGFRRTGPSPSSCGPGTARRT